MSLKLALGAIAVALSHLQSTAERQLHTDQIAEINDAKAQLAAFVDEYEAHIAEDAQIAVDKALRAGLQAFEARIQAMLDDFSARLDRAEGKEAEIETGLEDIAEALTGDEIEAPMGGATGEQSAGGGDAPQPLAEEPPLVETPATGGETAEGESEAAPASASEPDSTATGDPISDEAEKTAEEAPEEVAAADVAAGPEPATDGADLGPGDPVVDCPADIEALPQDRAAWLDIDQEVFQAWFDDLPDGDTSYRIANPAVIQAFKDAKEAASAGVAQDIEAADAGSLAETLGSDSIA